MLLIYFLRGIEMKILIDFTKEKNSWISAAIFYIHANNPNLEVTMDKNDSYDFSVENFDELKDILQAIKLPYLPILDNEEIVRILQEHEA